MRRLDKKRLKIVAIGILILWLFSQGAYLVGYFVAQHIWGYPIPLQMSQDEGQSQLYMWQVGFGVVGVMLAVLSTAIWLFPKVDTHDKKDGEE